MDTLQIKRAARERIEELEEEIAELKRIIGGTALGYAHRERIAPVAKVKRTRNVSAEARREQGQRMKERWAAIRAAKALEQQAPSPVPEEATDRPGADTYLPQIQEPRDEMFPDEHPVDVANDMGKKKRKH